jgi:FkbH-like protein
MRSVLGREGNHCDSAIGALEMMDAVEFLFPRDLEVTPSGIRAVLFIGSCLSEAYVLRQRKVDPGVHIDHILFNNAADLPERSDAELAAYDFQYVQLPLRSVLTDAVVRIADNDRREEPLDWFALGKANIDAMLDKAMAYNARTGLLTIISTFVVPQGRVSPSLTDDRSKQDLRWVVHELNNYLAEKARGFANTYLADVDMIADALGKRFFMDDFISFHTHGSVHYPDWDEDDRIEAAPFGALFENRYEEFFDAIFRQMECVYRTVRQLDPVKLVIFDLDNTLWRGQIAENYGVGSKRPHSDGWPLGVWECIQQLRWRGIAVAIASKNDLQLVRTRWSEAVDPPFVRFEDFVAARIDWRPKVEGVGEILEALSLTPKSVVFVDDHPVERESVRAAWPGIRVIGANPFLTRRILLWSAETQIASRTDETLRREEMLNRQIQREETRAALPREAFLARLETRLDLFELTNVKDPGFARASELVNKTNQFNTTGVRWSVEDYLTFWRGRGRVFAFTVRDRFAEYGLVGVIMTMGSEIVQMVMSCRVLGMDIELAAVEAVVELMRQDGVATVRVALKPTPSNGPCRDLFERAGFAINVQDASRCQLEPGAAPNGAPSVQVQVMVGGFNS